MKKKQLRVNATFSKDVYDWITENAAKSDITRAAFVKQSMQALKEQKETFRVIEPMMNFISSLTPEVMDKIIKGNGQALVKDRIALEEGVKLIDKGMGF
jgi:hypothetical protein